MSRILPKRANPQADHHRLPPATRVAIPREIFRQGDGSVCDGGRGVAVDGVGGEVGGGGEDGGEGAGGGVVLGEEAAGEEEGFVFCGEPGLARRVRAGG